MLVSNGKATFSPRHSLRRTVTTSGMEVMSDCS
jgi:hypothetical protein